MRTETILADYDLGTNSNNIKLEVNVGFRQEVVFSTVTLDSVQIFSSDEGEFEYDLGNGLDMKELVVDTRVKDTDNSSNPKNKMFISYTLTGGAKKQIFHSNIIEATDNETVLFKINIFLYA